MEKYPHYLERLQQATRKYWDKAALNTIGGESFTYGQMAYCTALANTGYHFVQWNDGNTDNPRIVTVTSNTTLTATFAPNRYTITLASNDTTNDSANEAWPEVAPAASPVGVVMVYRSRADAWTAVKAAVKAAVVHSGPGTWTAMEAAGTVMRTGKSAYGQYRRSDCYYEFLVHVEPSFLLSF